MEEHLDAGERPLTAPVTAITAPVMFAYASHFLLFHRVTEHSIGLLQRAFPSRFSTSRDRAVLEAGNLTATGVLERFAKAGYLEPAPVVEHRDHTAWVVPEAMRDLFQHELLRYGPAGREADHTEGAAATEVALRPFRLSLIEAVREAAADTADGESLIGELAVQSRYLAEWPALEELWYRYSMRIMVTDPVATHAAFGSIPELILHEHPGLRLAHVYVESTSVMQRIRSIPEGEDVDQLVGRLSLQVTESTASLGPRWRTLDSADARLHVGVNWMRFQRLRGDFTGAEATRIELGTLLDSDSRVTRSASDRNIAFFKLEQGILLFFVDRWPEALESLREATLLWQRPSYGDYVPAFALSLMGLIYELRGPREKAVECLSQAQSIFGEVCDFAYVSVLTMTVEAMLALDRLDLAHARDLLKKLEDKAPESELWPIVMLARQWADVLSGRATGAARKQGRLSGNGTAVGRLGPLRTRLLHRVRVDGLLAQSQAQRARSHLENHQAQLGIQSNECWAMLLLLAGRNEQALRHVDVVVHDPQASERARASAHLTAACAHVRLGDEAAADQACAAAVEELRHSCSLVPLAMMPHGAREDLLERCERVPEWSGLLDDLGLTDDETKQRFDSLSGGFPDSSLLVDLTDREAELLVLLDQRVTQAEMAKRLHLALSTVKKQVAGLYRKLGVESQTAALERAYRIGLFDNS